MSDKVNEFLKELAPMKETKFWHEFIARLMMGGGGGGGGGDGNKRIQPYYGTTMNHFNHNHSGRYPKLSSDSGLPKSGFAVANPQYNFNEKQYQQNLPRNKEFICSTITKDHHAIVGVDDDDDDERGLLVINPPVPVHIRMAKKYYSRIFSPPPPPPPPTPPPTPPKPKFFKLFQPSIYTPSKAKRRKLSVVRILPPSTYHQQQQPPTPPTQHQQQLFVPEKFDSFKPVNIHQNQNQIFYDCHFDPLNPRLNPTPPPTPQFPQLDPMIMMMMMMGEETSTTDDTLTEDATITTIGGDSQTIASPAPEQQQPTETEKELKTEPEQQPEQEEVPPASNTGAVHKEEDNIQEEVKSQPNKVVPLNVMVKDKPPKSPLQRSLSEPNAGAEKSSKAMSGLQKSPSRPIFTSSSFYDPNQHPTLEDQVKLCREIAKQLVSDDANAKSKGREMFERRVQKSARWITENDDSFENYSKEKEDYHERTIDDGPPNMKLLLDPRHVEDINTVQGVNEHIIVTQEAKTRDCCKNIVNDLNSPEVNPNRGNALFAKRVQKSDEWIVDDMAEQVIDAARDRLFRNVKQKNQSPSSMMVNQQWSTRSSPIPPPTFQQQHPYHQYHQAQPQPQPQPQQLYNLSYYSRPQIPGPIFSPVSVSPMSSRPSSSMSLMSQFKDFNARAKPFCRAY